MKKNMTKNIKEWNEELSALTKRTKGPEESVDQQRQCSRWNCLLIDSVKENSNGDTDKLENVINDDPEIDLKLILRSCYTCCYYFLR